MLLKIDELVDLIKVQLGVKQIKEEDHIVEDLGAESADIVNIIAAIEDRYQLKIGEEEIGDIRSVRDLFELAQQKLQAR